jgi:hypothetical protein
MSIFPPSGGSSSAMSYSGRPRSGSFVNYSLPQDNNNVTTLAVGEEGGLCPPQATTLAVGEEGGSYGPPSRPAITTQAIGEEGGYCPPPVSPAQDPRPRSRPYQPVPGPYRPPVTVPGGQGRPNYNIPPGGIFDRVRQYQPPRFEYHLSKICRPAPGTVIQIERHHEWGHSGCPPPPRRGTALGIFA